MSDKEKVTVISTKKGTVLVNIPDLRLRRVWARKGAKVLIDKEVLAEALFDPGTEYLFKTGVLYIEDMKTKKDLELEPSEAEEPVNVIVLNDAQKTRLLKVAPISELKETLSKLSKEQAIDLAQFAVEQQISDFEKSELLKAKTGIDIVTAIILNRDETEKSTK